MQAVNCKPKTYSVSVVIPTYNMGWCIQRAIESCRRQSYPVDEIVIVDDGSSDDTATIVTQLMERDDLITCVRLEKNTGHLNAIIQGIKASKSQWIALLDADDELTVQSVERRIEEIKRFLRVSGELPGLVYGHLYINSDTSEAVLKFAEVSGNVYPYLCRELSLCQTSTMLLRATCFSEASSPSLGNSWLTDDELVLFVAKRFPVACVAFPLAICYTHESPTRMSNDPYRIAKGIAMLVRDHRADILHYHGYSRLALWWLRVMRAYLRAECQTGGAMRLNEASRRFPLFPLGWVLKAVGSLYGLILRVAEKCLALYVRRHFDHLYF